MNKFWVVLSHTYMSRVKSKSFLITTIITLLFILAMTNIQSIIGLFNEDEPTKIAVVDESNEIYESLNDVLQTSDEDIELIAYTSELSNAKQELRDGTYDALLYITVEDELPNATYYTARIDTGSTSNMIEQQLQQIKIARATEKAGLDQAAVQQIFTPVAFEKEALPTEGGNVGEVKSEEELNSARGLVYVMLFLLYFGVLMYGNMIAMDVANEKTSRVMEILISSTSPIGQMFAKIIGIALLGLTQIGLFLTVGFILIRQKQDQLVGGMFEYFGLQDVQMSTFIYAIVFFLLGYLIYATLSAMLGSLVSRIEDVQQLMLPLTFLIMIGFFLAMFGLSVPDSKMVVISSFIPFFTPMLMFLRVGMLDVPFWEVGLSILIMIVTIIVLAIIGARVYKGGVLMYGKATSLKDIKKALQLSKNE
ncbi:ABC transporter permease [Radiobacillus sp. PE A8.2]|uniref:ABC transporter permease n=1 Tax=Radiobacillus sp. PE A8.2 TaxID=3380349 RepID=UPI00388E2969